MCVSDDLWNPEEENQGEPEWLSQERAHFSEHRDKNGDGKLDRVSGEVDVWWTRGCVGV